MQPLENGFEDNVGFEENNRNKDFSVVQPSLSNKIQLIDIGKRL